VDAAVVCLVDAIEALREETRYRRGPRRGAGDVL
jgi:hypothetical protein